MNNAFNTCRLCKKAPIATGEPVFQYGARHYVHTSCGIERWGVQGFLGKLNPWQLGDLPFMVLDRYPGALDAAHAILRRHKGICLTPNCGESTEAFNSNGYCRQCTEKWGEQ